MLIWLQEWLTEGTHLRICFMTIILKCTLKYRLKAILKWHGGFYLYTSLALVIVNLLLIILLQFIFTLYASKLI